MSDDFPKTYSVTDTLSVEVHGSKVVLTDESANVDIELTDYDLRDIDDAIAEGRPGADKKPSEMTYADYMGHVETAAEVAYDVLDEEYHLINNRHLAVEYAIEGDQLFTQRGYMLMTVYHSDQSPEQPDYTERWSVFVDFDDDGLTWTDCVMQMARVCYESDVTERLVRMLEDDEDEGAADE